MSNIIFVMAGFLGHLNSTFKLADDLRKRGHCVIYSGSEEIRERVRFQGFVFESIPFIKEFPGEAKLINWPPESRLNLDQRLRGMLAQFQSAKRQTAEAIKVLERIPEISSDVVTRLRPDLFIYDPFYLVYSIAFYQYQIPTLVLSTKPLFDKDPLVPPFTSALIPENSLWSRFLIQLAWLNCYLEYKHYKFRMFVRKLIVGLNPYEFTKLLSKQSDFPLEEEWTTRPLSFDFNLRSVPEIVLTSEKFDFPREKGLRSNVHYVGPCVHMNRREEIFDWNQIEFGEKLIYCSIGTVNPRNQVEKNFLHRIINVFKNRKDYVLILSVGPGIDLKDLQPVPTNVYLYRSVPQLQVLKKADLMITHGGSNSIKECILSGVPMIVYPRRADQPGNSARVVYHGLGFRGNIRKDSSTEIEAKIELIFRDPYIRSNLEKMQRHFQDYQSSDKSVELLAHFIAIKRADLRAGLDI